MSEEEVKNQKLLEHKILEDEYAEVVSKILGFRKGNIASILSNKVLKYYDIKLLLQKIQESDFLLGTAETKANINYFVSRRGLDMILMDAYKNFDKKSSTVANSKLAQDVFRSIITKRLWRKKLAFNDEIIPQVIHMGGGLAKLVNLPEYDLNVWVNSKFVEFYDSCSKTPLKTFLKIINEHESGEAIIL